MDYVSSGGRLSPAKDNAFGEGIGLRLSLNPRRKKVRFVFLNFGGRTLCGKVKVVATNKWP